MVWKNNRVRHGLSSLGIDNIKSFALVDDIDYKYTRPSLFHKGEYMTTPTEVLNVSSEYDDIKNWNYITKFVEMMDVLRVDVNRAIIKNPDPIQHESVVKYKNALKELGAMSPDDKILVLGDIIVLGGAQIVLDMIYLMNTPKKKYINDAELKELSEYLIYTMSLLLGDIGDSGRKVSGDNALNLKEYFENISVFFGMAMNRNYYDMLHHKVYNHIVDVYGKEEASYIFYKPADVKRDLDEFIESGNLSDNIVDQLSDDPFLLVDSTTNDPDNAIKYLMIAIHAYFFKRGSMVSQLLMVDDDEPNVGLLYALEDIRNKHIKIKDDDKFKERVADDVLQVLGKLADDMFNHPSTYGEYYFDGEFIDHKFFVENVADNMVRIIHAFEDYTLEDDDNDYMFDQDKLMKYFPSIWDRILTSKKEQYG